MENSKILSYVGFATKMRKTVAGVNAIEHTKSKVELLMICKTASANTFKDAVKIAKKHSAKLIVSEVPIETIARKEHCKLLAILDKGLAEAILLNLSDRFYEYQGGVR